MLFCSFGTLKFAKSLHRLWNELLEVPLASWQGPLNGTIVACAHVFLHPEGGALARCWGARQTWRLLQCEEGGAILNSQGVLGARGGPWIWGGSGKR